MSSSKSRSKSSSRSRQGIGRKISTFFRQYLSTRNYSNLRAGLPSLFFTIAAGSTLWVTVTLKDNFADEYRTLAADSFAGEQLEAAEVYYRRLARINENDRESQFALGLIAAQNDDLNTARTMMRRLAPAGEEGYARAHLWLARDRAQNTEKLDRNDLAIIEHDLRQAIEAGLADTASLLVLSQLLIQTNRAKEATRYIEAAADKRPELNLSLARLQYELGDSNAARSAAESAQTYLVEQLQKQPKDVNLILQHTESMLYLGQFVEAEIQLLRAMALATEQQEKERFKAALIGLLNRLAVAAYRENPDALPYTLRALDRALELDSKNPLTIQNFGLIATVCANDPDSRATIRSALERSVVDGGASASTHLILGALSVYENDLEAARPHFDLALEQNPESASVANNLAWIFAHSDPPRLDEALELSNRAVEKLPQVAEFLDTRGEIFAKLERWSEAVSDLEKAVKGVPPRPRLHETLARAYEQLGQPSLAELHREKAAEIQAAQASGAAGRKTREDN